MKVFSFSLLFVLWSAVAFAQQPVTVTNTVTTTGTLTDTELRATAVPVSGTVTANAGTGTLAVSGPLTDGQLRATPVPVSGTVTANAGTGTLAVSGPVTDTQLRATPVPISGTVTVTDGAGALNVIVDSGTTAVTNAGTFATQIVQGGNTAAVNASSQLSVNCANCSGSGVSHQDKTTFTPSTTNMVPVGGYRDDVTPSTVAEGEAAAARLTENRAIHVNLRDATGAELSVGGGTQYDQGTATTDTDKLTQAGAVRRDTAAVATGVIDGDRVGLSTDSVGRLRTTAADTTQPVSGTVTANAGTGTFTVGGTVTANAGTGTMAVSGPLTDTQLRATAVPVSGTVTANAGTGTMTVGQATATNLNAAVVGTGTAGSPAGNILTVQGVASMTKLLVTPDSVALPANQSVNVAQINGVATTMGNGVSGTGVQRVTIASDSTGQVALATGSNTIGALTANQSVNNAQIVGNAISVNLGASDTGTQRVALSRENVCSDMTNLTTVPIQTSSSGSVEIIALSGSTKIYVCDFGFQVQSTNLVKFVHGTSTNCSGGTPADLTGTFGGLAQTGVSGRLIIVPSGRALCVNNSAASAVGGWVTYRQF